jgi:hypothetical protein
MPLCQGGKSTWDVRGEGMLEVVCPDARQRDASVAAATGRKWRRSSCRAHNSNLQLPECGPVGRHDRVSQAVCNNEPNRSQQSNQDCTLKPLWMRPTSGRAKTTSVIDAITRRAAQLGQLAGTYPYDSKQSIPALLRAIRLQLRCNPDSRRNVRTRFFPSNLQFGRADGDAPV